MSQYIDDKTSRQTHTHTHTHTHTQTQKKTVMQWPLLKLDLTAASSFPFQPQITDYRQENHGKSKKQLNPTTNSQNSPHQSETKTQSSFLQIRNQQSVLDLPEKTHYKKSQKKAPENKINHRNKQKEQKVEGDDFTCFWRNRPWLQEKKKSASSELFLTAIEKYAIEERPSSAAGCWIRELDNGVYRRRRRRKSAHSPSNSQPSA